MDILKKVFINFLRIGVSVALLFFLFRQIDEKSIWGIVKNINKPLLLLAFFIFFFNYVLCFYRWRMLLKGAGIHLSLKRIIISFSGGIFFNLFLPSTIGGDLIRSIDLGVHTKRPKEIFATVILDRLSGYIGLVIVTLSALLFGYRFIQSKSVATAVLIIASILVGILLVFFNDFIYSRINKLLHSPKAGKIREYITDVHKEIYVFRRHKIIILSNILLSIMVQAIMPVVFYIIALALGVNINIIYFFVYLPIIGAITLLPISIGGLGLRDAITIFFFAQAGLSKDISFAMSLLNFSFLAVYAGIGGIIYVLTVRHRRI